MHMVNSKKHYGAIGTHIAIVQRPVKGRNELWSQRFRKVEMWFEEAYESAYNLREL